MQPALAQLPDLEPIPRDTAEQPPRAADDCELSIVMPCLNEGRTLATCIQKAQRFLAASGISGEIIVADNGSTDGSCEIARKLGVRVVEVTAPGYGAVLAAGIAAARGRHVLMGDSDDSYDFMSLMPFVVKLRQGFDLVVGNRFRGGIRSGAMPLLHRYVGNPLLTLLGRLFFRSPCGDFYCGLRGFTRTAAEQMELRSTGMEFALEMVVRATMLRMRITEVPTTLSPDGRSGRSHLRTWQDGWRSLRFLLLYSPRWLFLYPGVTLMLIGTFLGLWLAPGRGIFGTVTLDVHTLLYCAAAIVLGFQAVLFSLFSKIAAVNARLHPRSARLERWLQTACVEQGLAVGTILIAIGVAVSLLALGEWHRHAFGDLDPFKVMRLVIPAVLALIMGSQTLFASFYLNLLQIQCGRLRKQDHD